MISPQDTGYVEQDAPTNYAATEQLLANKTMDPESRMTASQQAAPTDSGGDHGIMNLHQFAQQHSQSLGHLNDVRSIGQRMVLGQRPAAALRGHIDRQLGIYPTEDQFNLLGGGASKVASAITPIAEAL